MLYTILLASVADDLHELVSAYCWYCQRRKSQIKGSKTKTVVEVEKDYKTKFYISNIQLENIWFRKTNKFNVCKNSLLEQARKTEFNFLRIANEYSLSLQYLMQQIRSVGI